MKVVRNSEDAAMKLNPKKKLTGATLVVEGGRNDANLRWLTGFSAPDPVLLLLHGGRKDLVVSILEAGRAETSARVDKVWTPQELKLEAMSRHRLSDWASALLKHYRIHTVTVAADFPFAMATRLQDEGVRVLVAAGPLCAGRRKKSAAEIRHITLAQRGATKAMKAAMTFLKAAQEDAAGYVVREGKRLRSEDVRRVIERQLLESDCVADEIIVAGGRQGAEPHERGSGFLRAGWPIVIDIFPRHKQTGYWGDLTRTVFVGRPKDEMRRMWRAVRAAQQAALREIRAGVLVKHVHQAAQRVLVDHGFETTIRNGVGEGFIHSTGHGIGLEIHEAPSISLNDTRLLTGDVVTVEPGLYYKRLGGVRIEDTVEVTKDGYRMLVPCPYGRV